MAKTIRPLVLLALCAGCRGQTSTEPPIHWQRNMFTQDKGKAQRENDFFTDHRAMRTPPEGTVNQLTPLDNDAFHQGKVGNDFVKDFPIKVTWEVMARGQQRFNIYCSPCHSRTGTDTGIVVQRAGGAMVRPPSYIDDRILALPVGQIFDTITHGVRTMPSYAYQVPEEDRWAIVAYVRALQRSQHATLADVPEDMRSNLK